MARYDHNAHNAPGIAKCVAYAGLTAALSVVAIGMGGILETNTLFLLALAAFLTGSLSQLCGIRWGIMSLIAAFLLAFLITPYHAYCLTFLFLALYTQALEYFKIPGLYGSRTFRTDPDDKAFHRSANGGAFCQNTDNAVFTQNTENEVFRHDTDDDALRNSPDDATSRYEAEAEAFTPDKSPRSMPLRTSLALILIWQLLLAIGGFLALVLFKAMFNFDITMISAALPINLPQWFLWALLILILELFGLILTYAYMAWKSSIARFLRHL